MPRPTVRGYALLGFAVGTYLAGRVIGTWELYLFAFAFLAAVILAWLLVVLTGRRLWATRSLNPERPVAGDEPEFTFSVENPSLLPGPQLTLHSPLAGLATADFEFEVESLVPRGERLVKIRTARVNRGVHLLPPVQAVAEDPLGITKVVRRLSDSLTVTVLPRIAFLDSCVLYPDIGLKHDWAGRHGLLAPGASEFRGVRPHQPGEPLSHIDWKSTAKTGTLMLRELEEPAGADITLLLDGTADRVVGEPPETNFELAVRAAGSIADFVLRSGRGVSLLCHERAWRQQRLTSDGGGRRSLLQALAEAQPNATVPLAGALRHIRTGGPHLLRAQSVTLVSMSLDHQLVRALVQLRDDGARPAFLYVVGNSFAELAPTASTLLPFLPPRDTEDGVRTGSDPMAVPRPWLHEGHQTEVAGVALPTQVRALLLSLSAADIPCLTLSHGDDLVRHLSLWRPGHRARAAAL